MKKNNDINFVEYYKEHSVSDASIQRFKGIRDSVLHVLARYNKSSDCLSVADIGCNAGTQMLMWENNQNTLYGVDISFDLVQLGLERAKAEGKKLHMCVASASSLPWKDGNMDVCLLPELLEHVEEWEATLNEAIRALKVNGVVYVSTTNVLCPKQEEFDLPLYSWYPKFLKKYYERLSVTSRPELVCHADYPAVHWFSYYQLKKFFTRRGFVVLDRFDILNIKAKNILVKSIIQLIVKIPALRFIGHLLTPYTVVLAVKKS